MVHRRLFAAIARGETLAPRSRIVGEIPIKRFGKQQALRGLQAERMNVADKGQQRRDRLTALRNSKLSSLLDGGASVAARICQADDLGLGGLRLKQERREIRGANR